MNRVAAVFLVLLGSAPGALATAAPSCCVCFSGDRDVAQTNGVKQTAPSELVFFCTEAGPADMEALTARCDGQFPGATLACETNIVGPSCREQLAESGFFCPVAGAPAAGPLSLAALAVILAALGSAAVHRRRRARAVRQNRR